MKWLCLCLAFGVVSAVPVVSQVDTSPLKPETQTQTPAQTQDTLLVDAKNLPPVTTSLLGATSQTSAAVTSANTAMLSTSNSADMSNGAKQEVKEAKEELPSIAIVIPSMRRWTHEGQPAPESYLKPLVDGIINSLQPEMQSRVSFYVMNVDKEPNMHTELLQVLNLPHVYSVPRPADDFDVTQLVAKDTAGNYIDYKGRVISSSTLAWRTGETRDVSHLLLYAMNKAQYVLMLEDDVVPTSHVMPKIYHFLEEMKKSGKRDFLMVDLYTPAVWYAGAATNMERYDYECCTQAMLFDSKRIPELVAYELENPQNPIDDNIREFVRKDQDNRRVYAMLPNPFQHVGAYSSNPEKSTGVVEHRSLYFEP